MTRSSSTAARRERAVESFQSAAETIGKVEAGSSLFAITRGQFSMIDAILHVIDQLGPSKISLWTWTWAAREVEVFRHLRESKHVTAGTLIIDKSAKNDNMRATDLLSQWRASYGPKSVRTLINHAKIATVDNGTLRVLLRGSMNLNYNPRFEQFDLTEGGADFDLVRQVEESLPILPANAAATDIRIASSLDDGPEQLQMFRGLKRWKK